MPDGGNPRAEELSWLRGSRGVAGTDFIISQGEGRHSEEAMKSPTWELSVLAIHMELGATAYFGVTMGELRSRLVCVPAGMRDSIRERKDRHECTRSWPLRENQDTRSRGVGGTIS